jgi:hypothetical protein
MRPEGGSDNEWWNLNKMVKPQRQYQWDRGISEGTNLNQMMIEIEQMRNLCVLYGSPPLLVINSENFVIILNSPHTTFTQGLDYNTYYPQYPTLKASPSNLQNVRNCISKNSLGLVLGT